MFIKTNDGNTGVSILLSGPNMDDLTNVKISIKIILKCIRHLYLENSMIDLDKKLLKSIPKSQLTSCGDLSFFIDEKLGLE